MVQTGGGNACSWLPECGISLCKDNANERKENVFSISRMQLILCKDNAREGNESVLSDCRAPLILCKDSKKEDKMNQTRKETGSSFKCTDAASCSRRKHLAGIAACSGMKTGSSVNV